MSTRCKARCMGVTKSVGFNGHQFVYQAKFNPCYGDSPENKSFFAATPSLSIEVGTVASDVFEVGKDYYVTFEPAPSEG